MIRDFQALFRQADEYAGIKYELPLKLLDTSEFDRSAIDSLAPESSNDKTSWWKRFKCYEHDLFTMRNSSSKIFVKPSHVARTARRIHYISVLSGEPGMTAASTATATSTTVSTAASKHPWESRLLFGQDWESNICWGTDAEDSSAGASGVEDLKIRVPINPAMYDGSWVRRIVWDDEQVDVYDDECGSGWLEDDYDEVVYVPVTAGQGADSESDSWVVLEPELRPSSLTLSSNEAADKLALDSLKKAIASRMSSSSSVDAAALALQLSQTHGMGQGAGQVSAEYIQRVQRQMRKEKEKEKRLKSVKGVGFHGVSVVSVASAAKRSREDIMVRRRRYVLPTIDHSVLALRHRNTRSDLRPNELRFFHHPRLPKKLLTSVWTLIGRRLDTTSRNRVQSQRRIQSQAVTGSGSGRTQESSHHLSDRDDFSITEGDFICVEYVERLPHFVNNLGMAIRILNFYRIMTETGLDDKNREDGAGGQTQVAKRRCSARIPRHLQYLLDESSRRNAGLGLEQDMDIPRLAEGQTIPLERDEDSPFLGDIAKGSVQPSIYCNLFQAPLFPHKANKTDFILIRVARSKGTAGATFLIRDMPSSGVFLCGQQEPQKIIPRPGRKTTKLQEDWILLQLARYFDNVGDINVDLDSVLDLFPTSRFRAADLKRQLARLADEFEGNEWRRKAERAVTEEFEMRVAPEDVCLQEASNAGEFRLKGAGIEVLVDTTKVESWLEVMLKWRNFCRKKAEKMQEMAADARGTQRGPTLALLAKLLSRDVQRIQRRLDIGRAIHERLLVAPWAASEAFVKGHLERGISGSGTGMLELTGPGDPSGVGEAFAYVRRSKQGQARRQGHVDIRTREDAPAAGPGSQICNTNRDLRKLEKKEARQMLVVMGMDPLDVMALKRWDLVAMIREMATKAEEAGTAEGLHRYAREKGKQVTLKEMVEDYKETCRVIWDRQCAALSSGTAPEEDMDDKDDDLDDMEDLYEDVERALRDDESAVRGASAVASATGAKRADEEEKRALKALQSELKAGSGPKTGSSLSKAGSGKSSEGGSGQQWRTADMPTRVVKRIIRRVSEDGKETTEIQFIISDAEVQRVDMENRRRDMLRQRLRSRKGGPGKAGDKDKDCSDDDAEAGRLTVKFGKIRTMAEQHERAVLGEDVSFLRPGQHPSRRDRLSGKRTHGSRCMRVPLMTLAAHLESVLLDLWRKPIAAPFLYPVDTATYPDYHEKVPQPISLYDIRNKLARGHYKAANSFLRDVKLLADNATLYNGQGSQIATHALSLFRTAEALVDVDRPVITEFEGDIRAKFAALGRMNLSSVASAVLDPPVPRISSVPAPSLHSFTAKSRSLPAPSKTRPTPASLPPPTAPQPPPPPPPPSLTTVEEVDTVGVGGGGADGDGTEMEMDFYFVGEGEDDVMVMGGDNDEDDFDIIDLEEPVQPPMNMSMDMGMGMGDSSGEEEVLEEG